MFWDSMVSFVRTGIKDAMRVSRKVDGIERKSTGESGTEVWALMEGDQWEPVIRIRKEYETGQK